jgi:hypothetical protein
MIHKKSSLAVAMLLMLAASMTLPGIWRQTATGPAQFSEFGSAAPFALLTTTQFLPAPAPQLESAEYAEDFNEVKAKGRATLSTRTEEETRFAQLFAGAPGPFANVTNPFRLWHNVARDLSQQKSFSLVQTARLFALLSASVHDTLQTAHTSKFVYRLTCSTTTCSGATSTTSADRPISLENPGGFVPPGDPFRLWSVSVSPPPDRPDASSAAPWTPPSRWHRNSDARIRQHSWCGQSPHPSWCRG